MLRVKSMWYGENDKVSVIKKEKKKDTRTTWFETSTATVPRQGARKHVGYFKRKQKNPQAHGYRCSFHPGVFQSIDFSQGT